MDGHGAAEPIPSRRFHTHECHHPRRRV